MSFSDLMLLLVVNQELAQRVSREMGLPLESRSSIFLMLEKFRLLLEESIRGKDVYICNPSAHRLTII